jgi:hypothetical protein
MLGDHVRLFEDCETSTALGTLGSATAAHPKMHLYNLTLKKASAVTACVQGQFSDAGVNEIVVSRGKILELLRQDKETNKMVSITTIEVFGYIRKLVTSRLPGATKDHIVLSSDSGKVSVLEYNNTQGKFVVLQCETFGKTGIRRITPGEYLAADIKGRAIMIGAVEKQKFVYVFNRDAAARLTISSPLEAHRSQTINFDIVAVDVDFDNPQFACLEVDYTPVDEDPVGEAAAGLPKTLAFYELDLGLNHVVRKSSEEVSHTANLLITVPGGAAGPSGVLVCAENKISYGPSFVVFRTTNRFLLMCSVQVFQTWSRRRRFRNYSPSCGHRYQRLHHHHQCSHFEAEEKLFFPASERHRRRVPCPASPALF